MINVSILKYEMEDFIDERDDEKFIRSYRNYIRGLSQDKLRNLFEGFAVLPRETLARLRVEYNPKTEKHHASIYLITRNPQESTYVLYKNDSVNPPLYLTI